MERTPRRTWPRPGPADRAALAERLASSGRTAAVVVPARDEAATVGAVVAELARLLGDGGAGGDGGPPILDELVVVDGASSDGTARIAARAGARVVVEDGGGRGKGDALATGLAATRADLVVFVDADVLEPDAATVVGLLTPLVDDPAVHLAKACYDRPLTVDGRRSPTGGGRVTELTVRPLLALLWPELADVAQPLAGEYAATRETLEALALEPGYGVELGILLDVARAHGVEAIAQVDLGARTHRHHDLATLGRMAAQVLAVALDRLAREGRVAPDAVRGDVLWQPLRDDTGAVRLTGHRIDAPVRPGRSRPTAPTGAPTVATGSAPEGHR